MLTLMEEMVLLALDEEKGKIRNSVSLTLGCGLAGALLLELYLRNKIYAENQILSVKNTIPMRDSLLDELTTEISTAKKPEKIEGWITRLYGTSKKKLRSILSGLMSKRLLHEEEKRVLFFFRAKRYSLKKPRIKRDLCKRIRSTVLRRHEPDVRMMCLLSLIHACDWSKLFFEKDQRKEAKARIKDIVMKRPPQHDESSKSIPQDIRIIVTEAIAKVIQSASSHAHS